MARRGHNDVSADPCFAPVYGGYIGPLEPAPVGSR
jgi:hypothetical protein